MTTANTSAAILSRLVDAADNELTPAAARAILQLDFHRDDHTRMGELSAKAQAGQLPAVERKELEEYLRIADFLAVFQSKARRSLKRAGRAS